MYLFTAGFCLELNLARALSCPGGARPVGVGFQVILTVMSADDGAPSDGRRLR